MANQTRANVPQITSTKLRKALGAAVMNAAKAYEAETRRRILSSKPTGTLYKRRRGFHRASARGQRPAVDSATMLRSFRTRQLSLLKAIVELAPNRSPDGASVRFYAEVLQERRGRKIMTDDDAKKAEPVLEREIRKALGRLT